MCGTPRLQAAAVTGELTSKWEQVESGIKRRVDEALQPYLADDAPTAAAAAAEAAPTAGTGAGTGTAAAAAGSTGRLANMVKSVADQVYQRSRKDREGLLAQLAATQAHLTEQVLRAAVVWQALAVDRSVAARHHPCLRCVDGAR